MGPVWCECSPRDSHWWGSQWSTWQGGWFCDVSQAPSKPPWGWLSRLVEHGHCGRDRSYAYPMGAYQYGLPFTKADLATVTAECLICWQQRPMLNPDVASFPRETNQPRGSKFIALNSPHCAKVIGRVLQPATLLKTQILQKWRFESSCSERTQTTEVLVKGKGNIEWALEEAHYQ